MKWIMNEKRPRKSSSDIEILPTPKSQRMSTPPQQGNVPITNETIFAEIVGIKNAIYQIQQDNSEFKAAVKETLDSFRQEINDTLNKHIQSLERKIDTEVNHIVARVEAVEDRVDRINEKVQKRVPFDPEVTVVAQNVKIFVNEQIEATCRRLLDVMGLNQVKVVRAERLESRDRRPGLVKIEFENLTEKVKVLRNKYNLNLSKDFSSVFIKSAQNHVERVIEKNMKTILKELPNGNSFKITSHGIIVKREERNTQRTESNGNYAKSTKLLYNKTPLENNGQNQVQQTSLCVQNTMGHTNAETIKSRIHYTGSDLETQPIVLQTTQSPPEQCSIQSPYSRQSNSLEYGPMNQSVCAQGQDLHSTILRMPNQQMNPGYPSSPPGFSTCIPPRPPTVLSATSKAFTPRAEVPHTHQTLPVEMQNVTCQSSSQVSHTSIV